VAQFTHTMPPPPASSYAGWGSEHSAAPAATNDPTSRQRRISSSTGTGNADKTLERRMKAVALRSTQV